MSEILRKLGHLVESEDAELAGASLKVVGALKVKSPQIMKAVKKHLENENFRMKQAAIDTLGKIGSRESISLLFPLFKNDPNLRVQVGHALSQVGDPILPLVEREYGKAASLREYKKSLLTVTAGIRTRKALKFLLSSLADSDLEILKHICYELRGQIEKLNPKEKQLLGREIAERARRASSKNSGNMLVSLVILLGYTADQKSKRILMHYLNKKYPFVLRRNALVSLGRIGLAGKGHEELVKELMPLFDDPDFAPYQRNLVEILAKIDFPKSILKGITRFAEHKSPELRRFALSKMGGVETRENVNLLVSNLMHADYLVRQSAEEALKKMPSSVPVLLGAIRKSEATVDLNRIGNILSFHRGAVTKPRLGEMFDLLLQSIEKAEDPKAQAYFNLLKQINPDFTHQAVMKEAIKLKKKKGFKEEIKLLEFLSSSVVFTKEAKWELLVAYLKSSAKDLSSIARNSDRALGIIQGMVKSGDKDLVKRLFREKLLKPEDIYYVGFHFSEKLFELKQFGIDVLKALIKKFPRNQYASQSKKRLQVVGSASQTLETRG